MGPASGPLRLLFSSLVSLWLTRAVFMTPKRNPNIVMAGLPEGRDPAIHAALIGMDIFKFTVERR